MFYAVEILQVNCLVLIQNHINYVADYQRHVHYNLNRRHFVDTDFAYVILRVWLKYVINHDNHDTIYAYREAGKWYGWISLIAFRQKKIDGIMSRIQIPLFGFHLV